MGSCDWAVDCSPFSDRAVGSDKGEEEERETSLSLEVILEMEQPTMPMTEKIGEGLRTGFSPAKLHMRVEFLYEEPDFWRNCFEWR